MRGKVIGASGALAAVVILSVPAGAETDGRVPAISAATPAPAPSTSALPHTGAAERTLVAFAGVLLLLGGWGLAVRRPSALH